MAGMTELREAGSRSESALTVGDPARPDMQAATRGTVVYASYIAPFPINSGERIRALNIVSALRSIGYRVEAWVANDDHVDLERHNKDGIRFHEGPLYRPGLLRPWLYFRPVSALIDELSALHRVQPLTAIVLDYGFLGAQMPPLRKLGVPIVLGTHNLESILTGQRPRKSKIRHFADKVEQAIEFGHERWFFAGADALICVSEGERRAYAHFVPDDRVCVVPNFVDVPDIYGDGPRLDRIIMTGSFNNFQNRQGLEWFVEKVWPGKLRDRTTLIVAGKLSDQATAAFNDPHIVGLGERDDLLCEIAQSRCAIVPLWHGAGTRLKCVEAMATRTPIVTTSKGCEGIDHGGAFLVADDPESFGAAIHRILDRPALASEKAADARSIFDRDYSLAANAARLERVLATAANATRFRRTQ